MLSKPLMISTSIVLLASCGAQPVGMAEMSASITATLSEASTPNVLAERTPIKAEKGFGPAIRAAVEANDGYRAAIALEAEAMGRVDLAKSALRPQLRGSATVGGLHEAGGGAQDETTTGVAGGINLSQLLYNGGETVAAINQSTAEALAAQTARVARANELALEAARAWIDVWQFQERLALLRASTSKMNELVAQIERMAVNGMLDRAALDRARGQIVDIRLEEVRLQSKLRDAQVRFERHFNIATSGISRPGELFSLSKARAAAKSWQQAPVLRRSAAELLIARSAVSGAEAAFRPRARLQAGVTSPIDAADSTDTSVGLVLEYTFGDGGRRRAQLEMAKARVAAIEAQLADEQRSLQAELDVALTHLSSIERSLPLLEEKMRLSESEAETARSQIATGQSNLRQLIDAEIEAYHACDSHITMVAERHLLLLSMAAMTGFLAQELGLGDSATR